MASIGTIRVNVAMNSARLASGAKSVVARMLNVKSGFASARLGARALGARLRSLASGAVGIARSAFSALGGVIGKFTSSVSRGIRTVLRFGAALAGITGVVGLAGIALTLRRSSDAIDELGKKSTALGVSTKELGRLSFAGQIAGTSLTGVANAIKFMSKNISEAATGPSEVTRDFINLNLRVEELAKLRPAEAFLEIADAIKDLPTAMQKTEIAMALFGKAGAEMLPLLLTGSEGIEDLGKRADELGFTLSDTAVRGIEAANDSLTSFKAALQGTANQASAQLAPFIKILADDLTQAMIDAKFSTEGLVGEFGILGAGIIEVVRFAQLATTAFTIFEIRTLSAAAAIFELAAVAEPLNPAFNGARQAASGLRLKVSELEADLVKLGEGDWANNIVERVRQIRDETDFATATGIEERLTRDTEALFSRIEMEFANLGLDLPDLPSPKFDTADIDAFEARLSTVGDLLVSSGLSGSATGDLLLSKWVEVVREMEQAKLAMEDISKETRIAADLAAELEKIEIAKEARGKAKSDIEAFTSALQSQIAPTGTLLEQRFAELQSLMAEATAAGLPQDELNALANAAEHSIFALQAQEDQIRRSTLAEEQRTRAQALTSKFEDPRKTLARQFADIQSLLDVGAIDLRTAGLASDALFSGLAKGAGAPEALVRGTAAEFNAALTEADPFKEQKELQREQLKETVRVRKAIEKQRPKKLLAAPP